MSIYCQACNDQKHGVKGSPLTQHTCDGFFPNWVSLPSRTINDILVERGIGLDDFAVQMGMSALELSRLMLGTTPIDEAIAEKLSSVLGVNPGFWLNRQRHYDEGIARGNKEITRSSPHGGA